MKNAQTFWSLGIYLALILSFPEFLFSQETDSSQDTTTAILYTEKINIQGVNYTFKLSENTIESQGKNSSESREYSFEIALPNDFRQDSGLDNSTEFTILNLYLSTANQRAVFKQDIYDAYFKRLFPFAGKRKEAFEQALNDFPAIEAVYSLDKDQEVKKFLKKLETPFLYDSTLLDQKADTLVKTIESHSEAATFLSAISAYRSSNQTAHGELMREILTQSEGFLNRARQRAKDKGNRPAWASPIPVLKPEISDTLQNQYKRTSSYLSRESITIGPNIYHLAVKEVSLKDGTYYVFKLQTGKTAYFFQLESVAANASTITALSQFLRNGLEYFLQQKQNVGRLAFEKQTAKDNSAPQEPENTGQNTSGEGQLSYQLTPYHLQRIIQITRRLEQNPGDFTSFDRDFVREVIREAGEQYGFDAVALRNTLKDIGLVEALENSTYKQTQTGPFANINPIDSWLNEAAIIYANSYDELDQDLRNIAANFLFVAYKNTIRVTQDSLEIGFLIARDQISVYDKNYVYKQGAPRPANKDEGDLKPVSDFQVKKIKIEFEDEMINNIEVRGDLGVQKSINATQIPDKLYLKVHNQSFTLSTSQSTQADAIVFETLWAGDEASFFREGTLAFHMVNFSSSYSAQDSPKELGRKDKKRALKELEAITDSIKKELVPSKFAGDSTQKSDYLDRLKARKQQIQIELNQLAKTEEISFDFFLSLKIPSLAFDRSFQLGEEPVSFDVEVYLDPDEEQLFRVYRDVIPYLYMGTPLYSEKIVETSKNAFNLNPVEAQSVYDSDFDIYGFQSYYPYFNGYEEGDIEYNYDKKDGNLLSAEVSLPAPRLKSFRLLVTDSKEQYIPSQRELVFQNLYPISYSTKQDVTSSSTFQKNLRPRTLYEVNSGLFIYLDEVLTNDAVYYNRTENYSPRDDVFEITEFNQRIPIYKEFARELLKAKVFSDFAGFDETNPNGLVQTEVSKKIFLNTNPITYGYSSKMYSGFLSYIEPMLVVSKIEEQNRYFPLKEAPFSLDGDDPTYYASTVDIFKHSNLQVGTSLGLFYLALPRFHTRLQISAGGYINQTGFSNTTSTFDSLTNTFVQIDNEFNGTSLVYYPEGKLEFNPDPRFGLHFAYRPMFVNLLSKDVVQVDNETSFLASNGMVNDSRFTHFIQMLAFLEVNQDGNGEFFFRTNYSFASDDVSNNFLQVQLGYSFSLITNTKGKDTPPRVNADGNKTTSPNN